MMPLLYKDKVRVTKNEKALLQKNAAEQGRAVNHIETDYDYLEATLKGLDDDDLDLIEQAFDNVSARYKAQEDNA
jgi:hypothetical protein